MDHMHTLTNVPLGSKLHTEFIIEEASQDNVRIERMHTCENASTIAWFMYSIKHVKIFCLGNSNVYHCNADICLDMLTYLYINQTM